MYIYVGYWPIKIEERLMPLPSFVYDVDKSTSVCPSEVFAK